MKDNRHRNYDYIPEVSKQKQTAEDLLNEIKWFIRHTNLTRADSALLNKLIANLELNKHSNKVVRSMIKRFTLIQQQYQTKGK